MRAQVAGGPAQDIGPSKPATTYAIVKGDQEFKVPGSLVFPDPAGAGPGAGRRRRGRAEGAFAHCTARPPAGSSFVRIVNPESAPMRPGRRRPGPGHRPVQARHHLRHRQGRPGIQGAGGRQARRRLAGGARQLHHPGRAATAEGHAGAHRRQRRRAGRAQGRAALQPDPGSGARSARKARRCSTISNRRPPPRHQSRAGFAGRRLRRAASAELALPALQPGDHYSLFLGGTAAVPTLTGQVSATDPRQQEAACAAYSETTTNCSATRSAASSRRKSRHTMPPGAGVTPASLWRRAGEEGLLLRCPSPTAWAGTSDTRRW